MKISLFISIIFLLTTSCRFIVPSGQVENYFSKISFKPDNYDSIVGEYSTRPNLVGENLVLFNDSSFQYFTWGDVNNENEKMRGVIGKYIVLVDTLYLYFLKEALVDSMSIVRKEFASKNFDYNKNQNNAKKYLFVKINNDLFIIDNLEKQAWIDNNDFIGNIQDRIINKKLKKITK